MMRKRTKVQGKTLLTIVFPIARTNIFVNVCVCTRNESFLACIGLLLVMYASIVRVKSSYACRLNVVRLCQSYTTDANIELNFTYYNDVL
jgi:hypothetical protein